MTLRQSAITAGLGMLIMSATAPVAEFLVFPNLIAAGNIEQTMQNIAAHRGLFVVGLLSYLMNFMSDVVIAWALYGLLAPVNRALALLAAWFRLIYTAMALVALSRLADAFRLVTAPDYLTLFGAAPLRAQVQFLLNSFRSEWGLALVVFGLHLGLLGYLVVRSGYIPRTLGILLMIDGLAWLIDSLLPYVLPNTHLHFISIAFLGELFFMVWLLARGWKIEAPEMGMA